MEFGSIDSESAVAVEIKHDDKLKEGDTVYFQVCYHSNHNTISLQYTKVWYWVCIMVIANVIQLKTHL